MMCSAFEEITHAVRGIKTSMHYYSTEFTESLVIVLLISRSERVRQLNIEDSYYHIPARYFKITAKQVVI